MAKAPSIEAFWCSRTHIRAMSTVRDTCGPIVLVRSFKESDSSEAPESVNGSEDAELALSRDSVIPWRLDGQTEQRTSAERESSGGNSSHRTTDTAGGSFSTAPLV